MSFRYVFLLPLTATFALPAAAAPTKKPVAAQADAIVALKVLPASLSLAHRRDARRVLVFGTTRGGTTVDLTDKAKIEFPGALVERSTDGYFSPLKVGSGVAIVRFNALTTKLPLSVKSVKAQPISFVRDIEPVLAKSGCNAGTCHGAAQGKNGFRLSLRGYDPDFDYHAIVDDVSGRRFNRAAPDQSLILLKPLQEVPHQGGLVFSKGSHGYRMIKQWVAEGVFSDVNKTTRVSRLEVLPKTPTLPREGMTLNQIVIAHYPDGTSRDVTREARFTSSVAETATVSESGTVTAVRRGETGVLVSYEGQFATNEFTILGDRTGYKWAAQPQANYVDELIDKKLQRIKAVPSPLASDAEFLRRAHLDLTGVLPTPEAARAFLEDTRDSKVKREELTEKLLHSADFDDHWTYKLADLLQVNRKYLGDKGMQSFRGWIHQSIAQNKPYDKMVRELLTTSGGNYENPASSYLKINRNTDTATENVTQLFLGVRFSCNKCHDHPFERWTQAQYYQFGAYFAQVGFKPGQAGEEVIFDRKDGEVMHPKTGTAVEPHFPVTWTGAKTMPTGTPRREQLAEWLTSAENPFFAKSMANRVWSYFMGRGIIDPVDDIRNSNPPSNGPLLDRLTDDFVKSGFDLRHLMKVIVKSRTYQSSIAANKWNEDDKTNFSHQSARRLGAEQLLDAISQATGSPQAFPGVPFGTRAQQLPDTNIALNFLDLFGRPARESPCECERTSEVSLAQALNLMNGETISNAISNPNGRVADLVKKVSDDGKLIEEIYLSAFSRLPTAKELDLAKKYITSGGNRLEGAQDLMWSLLNSPAFLFNR